MKPYPSMKDSGLPWLGEVPNHWEVRRLKQICRLAYGDALATDVREHGTVPVYGSNGRVGLHSSANTKAPCIVIGRKGSFGKVNFSTEPLFAIDTTFFVDQRFSVADVRWLFFLLGWLRLDEVSKDSAVPGLDREDAYQRVAALPPLAEQATIVRFLDHADRRIRRYIHAKQKLISLLEEQKQAIIHRAVTRGLDPDVRLKPSGVEWLGDVPEHWEVMPIKHVARMESGHTPSRANPEHWLDQNDIPWVSLNDTKQLDRVDYISDTALHINVLGLQNSSARLLPAGIVVFTRDAAVGKAAITTRPMAVSQHLIAWVCGPRILNSYLLRVFYTMKAELSRFTFGATIATIGMDDVRKLVTPVPPLDEQYAIATRLESACGRIAKLLACVQQELNVVREYRTRLIADVVTGKLDVRATAARLPDETEEPEPLDEADGLTDGDEDASDGLDTVPEEA